MSEGTQELNDWLRSDETRSARKGRAELHTDGGRTEPITDDNRAMSDFLRKRRGRMTAPSSARNATRR